MIWTHCPLCQAPLFEPMKPPAGEDVLFTCPECGGLLRLEQDAESGTETLVAADPAAKESFRDLL